MLSNYPDNMDWGAFDDYTDPVVECCERRASDCECPMCESCHRYYPEGHDWEEHPKTGEPICSSCFEDLEDGEE